MKFNLFLITLVFLAPCSNQVMADGAYIPRVAPDTDAQNLSEPVQRAIVIHFGDMERLILQVSFAGNVSEFAWLIPTPARPELSRDDTFSKYGEDADSFEKVHLATAPPLKYWFDIDADQFTMHARGPSKPNNVAGVDVLERRVVGDYNAAVLRARSETDLLDWLRKNNYQVTDKLKPVLADYIHRGWVFTAAKINTASRKSWFKSRRGMLESLQLQFASRQPIYPLKISSLNPGRTRIILYTVTDKFVTAPGFKTICAVTPQTALKSSLVYDACVDHFRDMLYERSKMHEKPAPQASDFANTPVYHITKLTAELDSSRMKSDVLLLPAKSQTPVLPEPVSAPLLDNIGVVVMWLMFSPLRFALAAICLGAFAIERKRGGDGRVWIYSTLILVFNVIAIIAFLIYYMLRPDRRIWQRLGVCIALGLASIAVTGVLFSGTGYGIIGMVTVACVGVLVCQWLRRMWLLHRKKALAAGQES